MSDFLSRLIERNQDGRESIRPRLGSLFEPTFPAGRIETQSIISNAPTSPPSTFPTLEAASDLPEGSEASPLQQAPHHSTTLSQPQHLPGPVLPQPSPPGIPIPLPGSDMSSAIPPGQHERRRHTVNADPAIPVSKPAAEPASSSKAHASKTNLAQDSASPKPQIRIEQRNDSPKADVRQAATAITPAPPESTSLNAPEPPSPQQLLDAAPSRLPGIVEQNLSFTVSPRQEALGNTTLSVDHPQPPVTPRIQPLPALSQPAPKPPTIEITIGRIDVRAQTPERHQPHPSPTRTRPRPALSLDDYLKQRGENS